MYKKRKFMFASEKAIYGLFGGLLGFFAPIYGLVIWATIFVTFDLISGVLAAKARGELLESRKLRLTVNKLVWYFAAIILAHGLDNGILPFMNLHLAPFAAAIICGVELYSVLENAYTITGNRVFWLLTQFTTQKIKDTTNIDVTKKPRNAKKK